MFPSGSILWADCSDGCPLLADISLSPWTAFDPQHPPTTVLYRPILLKKSDFQIA